METKKKVRRRKTSKKKITKKKIPSMKEREKEAKVINSTIPKFYQQSGFERINQIPDYTEKMRENRVETIIAHFYAATPTELQEIAKDPRASNLERQIAQMFIESSDKDNAQKHTVRVWLLERFSGVTKKEVTLKGHLNQEITHKQKKIDIDSLSDEELARVEKELEKLGELPTKVIEEIIED